MGSSADCASSFIGYILIVFFRNQAKDTLKSKDNFFQWKIPKSTQKAVRSKKSGINEVDNKDKDPEEIPNPKGATLTVEGDIVHKRYYHMFKEGELDQLVLDTQMARILKRGYDRDNWYIIAQKIYQKNKSSLATSSTFSFL